MLTESQSMHYIKRIKGIYKQNSITPQNLPTPSPRKNHDNFALKRHHFSGYFQGTFQTLGTEHNQLKSESQGLTNKAFVYAQHLTFIDHSLPAVQYELDLQG